MTRIGALVAEGASWLLVAGLFVAPLTLGKMLESRDLWAHLVTCALVVVTATSILLGAAPRLQAQPADAALIGFFAANIVAAIFTVYPHGTVRALLSLTDYLVVYVLVRLLLANQRALRRGVVAFACSGAACAALGLQEYVSAAIGGNPSWRAFGPFYNPNLLAAMLLMAIPLWIALVSLSRLPAIRLGAIFALALCWVGFFVTGSKGGALALTGSLIVGALLAPDPAKGGLVKRAFLSFGLVSVIVVGALVLPPIRVRLAQAFGAQSNSMMFRYYTWLGTWRMALERPVLGFGPGTFSAAYPRFAIVGHTSLAHETYLQAAAETGFFGLAALLGAVGTQLGLALRASRALSGETRTISAACAVAMVGFLLHNLVDYAWHVTATGMAFWVLAGFVAAARHQPHQTDLQVKRFAPQHKAQPAAVSRRVSRQAGLSIIGAGVVAVPAILSLRALSLAEAGDYASAARLDPFNDTYRRQMALLVQQQARSFPHLYNRAIAEWKSVARLRPTYPGTYYNLGRIAEERGRFEQALAEYQRAQHLAPTWTNALVAEAQLLEKMGHHKEALVVWKRLDTLADSPLFRYRAVSDDLDPNFARAWLAIGDSLPFEEAKPWYVRAARYLREVMAANRRMEGIWRHSGEWERRQNSELVELAIRVAQRHQTFRDLGPRLRAALLLVDAGQEEIAKELFVTKVCPPSQRELFEKVIDVWQAYVSASHLVAQGNIEAARSVIGNLAGELSARRFELYSLLRGRYGWSEAELRTLTEPEQLAKYLSSSGLLGEK